MKAPLSYDQITERARQLGILRHPNAVDVIRTRARTYYMRMRLVRTNDEGVIRKLHQLFTEIESIVGTNRSFSHNPTSFVACITLPGITVVDPRKMVYDLKYADVFSLTKYGSKDIQELSTMFGVIKQISHKVTPQEWGVLVDFIDTYGAEAQAALVKIDELLSPKKYTLEGKVPVEVQKDGG